MARNRRIDPIKVLDMHEWGFSTTRIAARLGTDVATVEYIIDSAWLQWAAQYGYDN